MTSSPKISRRDFHGRALAAGAAALGATILSRPAAAKAFPAGKYFDIHTHLGQQWGVKEKLEAVDLLKWMDEHEIAQAAVLPLINPESWDHPS